MYDEDQETLAAEYVLGTLSSEERQHAEALRSFDAKFESSVQQWERRLGELNVMVEAVEPSPAVWEKVKTQIEPGEERSKSATPERPPPLSAVAALASDLPAETESEKSTTGGIASGTAAVEAPPKPRKVEPNANIVVLSRRARRWRRVSLAVTALAAA